VRVCGSCGEENSDRAAFCQRCGTKLVEGAASRETRKVVTVLFADVTGSTSLGEQLDPESLRNVMGRFFDAMRGAVERHGGVVEKFIGDAVMAVFGIPRLHEDDAVRAVRAASEMREALGDLNEQLHAERGIRLAIRTGITTGEVVAGDPTTGQRLVTGDTVNTAARLEQHAQPGEILIGEPTYRLIRDAVTVEATTPLVAKGKAEPLPAYRLVAIDPGAESHTRRLDSPMVGRDRELQLLEQALDRVRSERTAYLFSLLGPAGVGKSRLVLEFVRRAEGGAAILRGRCLSYGEGITFFPLAEVVHEAAGFDEDDAPAESRRKLEAVLKDAEHAAAVAAGVAGLIGLDDRPVATEDAHWAVRRFLEALAEDRPLVVVFDDIHWAEPAFLDVVEHVADWSRDAPILLLCVARPELLDLRPGWSGGKLNAQSILLEPLANDQAGQLVDNLLGAGGLPAAARTRILEAAEGNPLFVEEMLGMLVDDGLLTREDGRWVAGEEVEHVTIPPTIQLLLAARLDRLDADERAVAERASVEGKVFHRGAVMRLSPDGERPQVSTRLLALARKELIRPDRASFAGEDAFRFRHLLIRDAAYQGMPKEARAELHERFADWLREQAGDRLAEYEDIVGYHLEQAYRYRVDLGPADDRARDLAERAAAALAGSSRRALEKRDHAAAAKLLRRTVDLMPKGSPDELRLRFELAETLRDQGAFPEMRAVLDGLIDDARRTGERGVLALATAQQTLLEMTVDATATMEQVLAAGTEARRTLEELGDERGAMKAAWLMEQVLFWLGRLGEANRMVRERLEKAGRLQDVATSRDAAIALSGNLYWGPAPASEVLAETERLLPFAEGSPMITARMQLRFPTLYAMLRRFDEARDAHDQVRRMLEEIGNPLALGTAAHFLCCYLLLVGDVAGAEREARASEAILDSLGEKGFLASTLGWLAEALVLQGRFDEAEDVIERTRRITVEDDVQVWVAIDGAMASVLVSRGRLEDAERLARKAVGAVSPDAQLNEHAGAWARLGEVLRAAGRTSEARDAFSNALAFYRRKENLVSADLARRALDELPEI
jgi:class 3 adenylate cyclase/tetratricopeptide (TPR) repeat protein